MHMHMGVQRCMHASDLLACGGGLGVGSHSVLHACIVSFYMHMHQCRSHRCTNTGQRVAPGQADQKDLLNTNSTTSYHCACHLHSKPSHPNSPACNTASVICIHQAQPLHQALPGCGVVVQRAVHAAAAGVGWVSGRRLVATAAQRRQRQPPLLCVICTCTRVRQTISNGSCSPRVQRQWVQHPAAYFVHSTPPRAAPCCCYLQQANPARLPSSWQAQHAGSHAILTHLNTAACRLNCIARAVGAASWLHRCFARCAFAGDALLLAAALAICWPLPWRPGSQQLRLGAVLA
jgi:hypothetical protein